MLKDQRGVTLVETMAAIMIISFSVMGLFSAYAYGRLGVERAGVKRQALEILAGQMENMKNARLHTPEDALLPRDGPLTGTRDVLLDADKGLRARLSSEISEARRDYNITYQEVRVTLAYDNGTIKDSLELSTKMYLR